MNFAAHGSRLAAELGAFFPNHMHPDSKGIRKALVEKRPIGQLPHDTRTLD